MCAILGCAAQVCLLTAVLCGSPVTVCPYLMSWWCAFVMGCVSILCISGDLCVQSVLCVRLLVFHLGGVVFDGLVTGSQTCLVIVTWHCDILLIY